MSIELFPETIFLRSNPPEVIEVDAIVHEYPMFKPLTWEDYRVIESRIKLEYAEA